MDIEKRILANKLIFKRLSYEGAVNIYNYSSKFEYDDTNEEIQKKLGYFIKIYEEHMLPLPSGRLGSALGLMLESNHYKTALYILKNRVDDLSFDLDRISMDVNGENVWGIEDTLEFSLLYFENRKISDEEKFLISNEEAKKIYIQKHNEDVDAVISIRNIINKLKEDSKSK